MSSLTPETVAEALTAEQYTLSFCDVPTTQFVIACYYDDVVALCRAQHEALRGAKGMMYCVNVSEPYNQEDFDIAYEAVHNAVALMPQEVERE